MSDRVKCIELRCSPIYSADLAAEIVRAIVRASGKYKLRVSSIRLEIASIQLEVRVPSGVVEAMEATFLQDAGSRLVDAVFEGVRRVEDGASFSVSPKPPEGT